MLDIALHFARFQNYSIDRLAIQHNRTDNMPKRRKGEVVGDVEDSTPRKSRRTREDAEQTTTASLAANTPSRRKSILRGTPTKVNGEQGTEETPKSVRKVLFSTPSKVVGESGDEDHEETPTAIRNDRSARRKSSRALQKRSTEDVSEDEDDMQEAALAQEILEEGGSEEESDDNIDSTAPSSTAITPRKRGRPKGKRRERTPSPPRDLPPHELYFFQNRTGANKTSSNTLPSHLLQNHEDFFTNINAYKDPHEADIKRLKQYHKRAFDQWGFELEEGFNICLYGYGSKRDVAMDFAEHFYYQAGKPPKIVVVNGYTPGLTARDALSTLASVILPKDAKLPAQPTALVDVILATLSNKPPSQPIRLIIHSLDHANLRKPATQTLLARLAAHQSISILVTCDTPNFPLLWDTTHLRRFRWLYHDATTFQPYTAEIDVVEEVNALLGRSGRRLGGKDGVGYVLKSLPENARNLFRILVAEQLAQADADPLYTTTGAGEHDLDSDSILGASDEEEAAQQQNTPSRRKRGRPAKPVKQPSKVAKPSPAQSEGVEYRTLYHKAVEEFVCSSELNFRTLLKEFHDHQMIESRKDGMGTERLVVPFRREELEGVLEELV